MGDAATVRSEVKAAPLVVDLDDALLRTDLLLERALAYARTSPKHVAQTLLWSLRSGALTKNLDGTELDAAVLPFDPAVSRMIAEAHAAGREVVLVTSERDEAVSRIAKHFAVATVVAAGAHGAHAKRDALVARFGEYGFDYVGNGRGDVAVWSAAREAHVVRKTPSGGVYLPKLKAWLSALRLHQWVKNALIFVPLLSAHQVTNPVLLGRGVLAFLLFGLCASSVYLLNDLLDLEDDRHHNSKRQRPFASGELSIKAGLIAFPLLLVGAFAGAFLLLPWQFGAALGIYYMLTLSYSLSLKRQMAIDVIALALLYTVRVIAGVAAFQITLTFWLVAFSTFMFLSLALAKRYGELKDALARGNHEKTRGRDYDPRDLEMIAALGAAAGYQAVIVLALYVRDQNTVALYSNPDVIWLACPLLLFWVTRVWMITHRGQMHDDPVVFAVTDRVSLIVGVLFGLVFLAAT